VRSGSSRPLSVEHSADRSKADARNRGCQGTAGQLSDRVCPPARQKMDKPKRNPRARGGANDKTRDEVLLPKVVVRRLPPTLPVPVFASLIQPWETDVQWWEFIAGKAARTPHATSRTLFSPSSSFQTAKPAKFGRAYITFKTTDALKAFMQGFGATRTFVDKQGQSWEALVEFAPFQKTALPNVSTEGSGGAINSQQGTLGDDVEFQAFCQQLLAPTTPPTTPTTTPAVHPTPKVIDQTTPIITLLRQRQQHRPKFDKVPKQPKKRRATKPVEVPPLFPAVQECTSLVGADNPPAEVTDVFCNQSLDSTTSSEKGRKLVKPLPIRQLPVPQPKVLNNQPKPNQPNQPNQAKPAPNAPQQTGAGGRKQKPASTQSSGMQPPGIVSSKPNPTKPRRGTVTKPDISAPNPHLPDPIQPRPAATRPNQPANQPATK